MEEQKIAGPAIHISYAPTELFAKFFPDICAENLKLFKADTYEIGLEGMDTKPATPPTFKKAISNGESGADSDVNEAVSRTYERINSEGRVEKVLVLKNDDLQLALFFFAGATFGIFLCTLLTK
jgi:hypothetical protein